MIAQKLKKFFKTNITKFPYKINIEDWEGNRYSLGLNNKEHWRKGVLNVKIKTKNAAKKILAIDSLGFLECFLRGEVDMEDNLYILPHIQDSTRSDILLWQKIPMLFLHKSFQNISRARQNVCSHYDIPQSALDIYLDKIYLAYSCAIFENPYNFNVKEMLKVGRGKNDKFDSLEKAQWRKFKDAVDFINPKSGDTLLDVGCGYGGQLIVALENYPFGKVVGWTHSKNQVVHGSRLLSKFSKEKWEIREGDYRQDRRVFDHITSTGMACHVGPRGLAPYVKNIRKRIKKGGKYVHHVLMTRKSPKYFDFMTGIAFNKKYVWPGFHWFTLGQHIAALEENGFKVRKVINLGDHYRKTTAAWYERMVRGKEDFIKSAGMQTFRAWQIYLAGGSENFSRNRGGVYRIYCEAI